MAAKAHYIMIGGFLGAGKSTSILKLARRLAARGQRVGLITNDQGEKLVDTTFLNLHGFPVEEIAGGCFCCRFNSLVEAADKLTRETQPDFFIAEPVGSCTDLVATVSYPLRRIYGDKFTISPLSVLVDPVRASRIFKIEPGNSFSEKVIYVYRKQLEEADIIVINKSDLLIPEKISTLQQVLAQAYPTAQLHVCSARQNRGLDHWFDEITFARLDGKKTIDINYEIYGEGEALLSWLNATVNLQSNIARDGNSLLVDLAGRIKYRLVKAGAEIAHLKMTLSPNENLYGELGVVNLVRNDHEPELSQRLPDEFDNGQLIINLRAEAAPEVLREAVTTALMNFNLGELSVELDHLEHFRPVKPKPVYRENAGP